MADHIPNERLAALLDDGVDDDDAREHLAACPRCERELDLLRRMRMALSAMDELEPPSGQWERIEAGIARDGATAATAADAGSRWVPRVRDVTWLRAAAGIVLFAGGLWVGSLLGPLTGFGGDERPAAVAEATDRPATDGSPSDGSEDDGPLASGDPGAAAGAVSASAGTGAAGGPDDLDARDTDEILRRLEALGGTGFDAREAYRDPTAAAERLARLDALVRAAREALEEDPADPAMNQLLFRVVEERQQLNQALHMASLDYR